MAAPTVFIGSSSEQLSAARALKACMRPFAQVTVWDEPEAFRLNQSIFDGLLEAADRFDFAVFIFGADDVAVIRKAESRIVRDNVVFELGLFTGRLGSGRAFWLSPDHDGQEHLPSDLEGIIHLSFEAPRTVGATDVQLRTALAAPCERLRSEMGRLGPRTDRPVEELHTVRILCVASPAYSAPKFAEDLRQIQQNFPSGSIESAHGVGAEDLWNYFSSGRRWDIVHLAMYVDPRSGDLLFTSAEPRWRWRVPWSRQTTQGRIRIDGVEAMIKDSGARLVVVVTCDSLVLGARIARTVNTIAGHRSIDVREALNWSAVFYRNLAQGRPLSEAFYGAQAMTDPGLMLLAKRDFKLSLHFPAGAPHGSPRRPSEP
jgi:hypothetical protein